MVKGKFGKTSKVSKYYEDDCSFKPNFGPFWSKFDPQKIFFVVFNIVKHCCKLSLHSISRKTNEPNLKK